MAAVELKEAGGHLSELVDEAARGHEVVLTRGGEPVARIVSIQRGRRPRQFGSARGMVKMSDDFDAPLEEFCDYM